PDDMEEILKGLGYRADAVSAAEAAAFLSAQEPAAAETQPAAVAEMSEGGEPRAEDASPVVAEDNAQSGEQAQPAAETVAEAQEPQAQEAASGAAPVEAGEPEAPKPVLLWRPGGRNDNQRGGRPQQGERRPGARGEKRAEGDAGQRQGARPNRENRTPEGRPARPGRGERNERQERGKAPQQPARFESKPPRKEKPIDPDSP